jgi:hypothetical protein
MARKKRRGRPPTYKSGDRRKLADMIRLHGARGTRELTGRPISVETLMKIAREFDIELKKGRRPRPAATRSGVMSTPANNRLVSSPGIHHVLPAVRAVRALIPRT